MSKYRNIKIHVPTPEISEKVQLELVKQGCGRHDGEGVPANLDCNYIHVCENGIIRYSPLKAAYANLKGVREVPYQSIIDPYYDVKIAWANGEVVQRIIQTKKEKKWVDWNHSSHLDIEAGYDWRIKPKAKTIKQWERKYLQGGLVMTMVVSGPDDSNNMECWIGEAYEAEYEVPND